MSSVSRYLDPQLVQQLNHLQLSARSVVEGGTTGLHRSPIKGASVDFRQHRFYVPGDEPRRLDWRILARTDRPYIKEYDEETNLRCAILLDRSGSMAYGSTQGRKFDYAARLVVSLAYLMLSQTEAVGLGISAQRLQQYLPPHASTQQLSRIIELLDRASPDGPGSLSATMHDLADRLKRRALVIIVSDLFEPVPALREAFAHLRHDRHEVIAMRVLDDDELSFPFRSWSRFQGLEQEYARLCEPALVRKSYLKNFERHRHDLEQSARALGVEHHLFPTDRPLIASLTEFLQRRRL